MRGDRPRLSRRGSALLALVLCLLPQGLQAQEQDFLFKNPRFSLALHGGYHFARANSQVFDFTIDNLTVESSDFSSPAFRFEFAVRVVPRLDLSLDVAWSTADIPSESRDFIGTDDQPILQQTSFSQTPISFNAKYYVKERGTSIGRFAWIPSSWSAYVGGGLGFANYSFRQSGEFVIEETLDIVFDDLRSSSRGELAQVMAGIEYGLFSRALLVLDGRYRWASADMRSDWVGFDNIDLSGLSLSMGVALRF